MTHRALLAGIGKMGRNHAKTVMSDDLPTIELAAVCDCDIDNLIAFRQENPNIPVFLTPKDGNPSDDDLGKAVDNNIDVYYSIAELVSATGSNTLINATHNESHLPILRDALSAKDVSEKPLISIVFQEKPFTDLGEDTDDIEELIQENNIIFNLNGTLTFSPIWNDFNTLIEASEKEGFEVTAVYCAYGKDRTKDTRPAPGGWAGMDGIHAFDISTGAGLTHLTIDEDTVKNQSGFLADGAGEVPYQTKLTAQMTNKQGNSVDLKLEGSFAWASMHRHVQYELKNQHGDKMLVQLDFDQIEDGLAVDVMHSIVKNKKGKIIVPVSKEISAADKLQGYYQSALDKNDKRHIYDLKRAMAVQKILDVIASKTSKMYMPALRASKQPKNKNDIALLMNKPKTKQLKPAL